MSDTQPATPGLPRTVAVVFTATATLWGGMIAVIDRWLGLEGAFTVLPHLTGYLVFVVVSAWGVHRFIRSMVEKAAEVEARKQEDLRQAAVRLERANRLFATLARTNEAALVARDRDGLCVSICDALIECAGMKLAWVGWPDPGSRHVRIVAVSGPSSGYADGLMVSTDSTSLTSRGPAGQAMVSGVSQVCNDVLTDTAMGPWRERAERHGLRSIAAIPVRDEAGQTGVIGIYAGDPGVFDPDVLRLAERIAADLERALGVLRERTEFERQALALRESEERYRSLFEQSNAVMFIIDPENATILDANPAAARFYGWTRAELQGMQVSRINTLKQSEILERMRHTSVAGRSSHVFQHRLSDGSVRDVEVFSGPLAMHGRMVLYSIVHDITDRRRMEARLQDGEERLQLALRATRQGIYDLNVATGEAVVSPEYASMLGYDPDTFRESNAAWIERLHPDDHARVARAYQDYVDGLTGEYRVEFRQRTSDGGWKWILSVGKIMSRDSEGRPLRMIGTHTDIDALKQADMSLRHQEEVARTLLDLPALAERMSEREFMQRGQELTENLTRSQICFIHLVNPDDRTIELVAWSKRTLEHFCTAEYDTHYPVEQAGIWADALREARPILINDYASHPGRRGLPKGHAVLNRLISVPVLEDGRVVLIAGVGNKETDYNEDDIKSVQLVANLIWRVVRQRRALAELKEVNAGLSAIFQASPVGIISYDHTGQAREANEAAARILGGTVPALLAMNFRTISSWKHSGLLETAERALASDAIQQVESHFTTTFGKEVWVSMIMAPIHREEGAHLLVLINDVAEHKALERRVLRSQRMESIGLLAGGIAHDLNNVLAPILLSVELLRMRCKDPVEQRTLEVIESSARRGTGVVKQVLTFARGIEGDRMPLRPRDIVRELVMIVEETFPRNINVRREVAGEDRMVAGDATQLHQVLLNLAVNARDAMPEGGTITFRTELAEFPEIAQVFSGELRPGTYVRISVRDTGCGMSADVRDRVFEPFFTTKSQGKGTGLGLPTALGIIRSHGGVIDVLSEPGKGSEFRVYLPALPAEERAELVAGGAPSTKGDGRTILLCDDEASIREIGELVLARAGFKVLLAANGREAVQIFERDPDSVSVIVMDIMMPLMTGDRAAVEILRKRPGIPILFMSGLMEKEAIQSALKTLGESRVMLLRKPFVASDLLHQIGEALRRPAIKG